MSKNMKVVTIINEDQNITFETNKVDNKESQPLHLVFRRFNGNYYISDNTYELSNDSTPIDSLVCTVQKTWDDIVSDKLNLHILPKKLPSYIIDGFKLRLENDIKRSLYNEYKAYEQKHMLSLFNIEQDIFVKKKCCEAENSLVSDIKLLTKIEDFFDRSISIQKFGAVNLHESKDEK